MRARSGWLLVTAAVAAGVVFQFDAVDANWLFATGAKLFRPGGLHIYEHTAGLQAGPLSLPVFSALAASGVTGIWLARAVMILCGAGIVVLARRGTGGKRGNHTGHDRVERPLWLVTTLCLLPGFTFNLPPLTWSMGVLWLWYAATWAVVLVARRRAQQPPLAVSLTRWQWLAVLSAAPWTALAGGSGHVEDALAMLLLTAGLVAARAGRPRLAGLLIGCAIACKPWAVAGIAVPWFAASPSADRGAADGRLAGIGLALAVPIAAFAPFVIAAPGTVHAAAAQFPVSAASVIHLLGMPAEALAPHWLRSVQLGAAVIVAAGVTRRSGPAEGIAAGLIVRLLLDPAICTYYSATVVAGVAIADLLAGRSGARTAAAVVASWLLPSLVTDLTLLGLLKGLTLLGLVAVLAGAPVRRAALEAGLFDRAASLGSRLRLRSFYADQAAQPRRPVRT